jgi:hypothetical protein
LSRSYISPWFIIISCKSKWFVCVWDWHLNKFLLLWCLHVKNILEPKFFLKKPNIMLMKKAILIKHEIYLIRIAHPKLVWPSYKDRKEYWTRLFWK